MALLTLAFSTDNLSVSEYRDIYLSYYSIMHLLTGAVTLHVQELRMCDKAQEGGEGEAQEEISHPVFPLYPEDFLSYCCTFTYRSYAPGRHQRTISHAGAGAEAAPGLIMI
jgi:hypothetical protein